MISTHKKFEPSLEFASYVGKSIIDDPDKIWTIDEFVNECHPYEATKQATLPKEKYLISIIHIQCQSHPNELFLHTALCQHWIGCTDMLYMITFCTQPEANDTQHGEFQKKHIYNIGEK